MIALGKLGILINKVMCMFGGWVGANSAQSMVPPQPRQTKRVGMPTTKRQILDILDDSSISAYYCQRKWVQSDQYACVYVSRGQNQTRRAKLQAQNTWPHNILGGVIPGLHQSLASKVIRNFVNSQLQGRLGSPHRIPWQLQGQVNSIHRDSARSLKK